MDALVHNVWIITMENNEKCVPFYGYLVIRDGRINDIDFGKPDQSLIDEAKEVIDGGGKWLMPGLVNTHGHLGSSLLRGHGDDLKLDTWLKTVMWPNEAKFDQELVQTAAELAMMEMISSGTTTFLDMYHLAMPELAQIVREKGLRAVLCRGMIAFGTETEQDEKIQEAVSLADSYHKAADGRIRVMMSPHAPYTCPPEFYLKAAEQAKNHELMLHTHISESPGEVDEHLRTYGMRPVEHMHRLGLLNDEVLLAHAVHLTDEELAMLKETNTAVSHNPMSNLKLGSGIARIPEMKQQGIRVSLGTDSTASNNNLDLFEEMRFAALIHKGVNHNPESTDAYSILRMATEDGAAVLGYSQVGTITKGADADFILIDPDQPHLTPWTPERVISHLVYAVKGSDVTDVWIRGRRQLENRTFLEFDRERIIHKSNELVKYFE